MMMASRRLVTPTSRLALHRAAKSICGPGFTPPCRTCILSSARPLSSVAAPSETATKDSNPKNEQKKDKSNIFLDNIGTIFLSAIGLIILAVVRSSFGSSNRKKARDKIEDEAWLDPLEIDDLRVANSELTPEVFRTIMENLKLDFPHGTMKYREFVHSVRRTMKSLKGDNFTVELGHLVDRAVDAALANRGKTREDEMPILFFLTALSLAMDVDSSTSDRIRILYEGMELKEEAVTYKDVLDLVSYLQDTFQLPPETQVVTGENKIPTQEYKTGSPQELVAWDGTGNDVVDLQAFASILRSQSVCAWGECFFKKKPPL